MPTSKATAQERVRDAYRQIDAVARPEVWITLRPEEAVHLDAREVDENSDQGQLPLAGCLLAVKDNIDVAGLPTTAGCPPFAYLPSVTAPVVQRMVNAGAVVLGKTNLDQFATGLVGTRSPYGAVRSAGDPAKVAGGSSAGSAVAVALGLADIGIGTDTAGSGRIPAAFNGVLGFKPTRGLLPLTGVVPAARSYDCISVLTRSLALGQRALSIMAGPDPLDPGCRVWPDLVRLAAPLPTRLAVPQAKDLAPLTAQARSAFHASVEVLSTSGVQVEAIDASTLLEAARILYDGSLVAERYASVGAFISQHQDVVDPCVAKIVLDAGQLSAHQLASDQAAVALCKAGALAALAGFDALLLPTAPLHPSIAAVHDDPLGLNRLLGMYTNFVNVLDMAALAIPAGEADGSPFGVSIVTRAFDDQIAVDLAAVLLGQEAPSPIASTARPLLVADAHRHPMIPEKLMRHGGRLLERDRRTIITPAPRPHAQRPALHTAVCSEVRADHWSVSIGGLGWLLCHLPLRVTLDDVLLHDGEAATLLSVAHDDVPDLGSYKAFATSSHAP